MRKGSQHESERQNKEDGFAELESHALDLTD
jgi:hypothetical protein